MQDFIHLHVHTEYSILDGQASVPKLVDKAIRNNMKGMAVTDHGNMMGIKDFFNYTQKVVGKAKSALKVASDKLSSLEDGTYTMEDGEESSIEDLLSATRKEVEKQKRIVNFKPIFGCEMYVARRGDKSLKEGKIDQSGWHLVVLAKNKVGYHNLIKLVSRAWVDGFYTRPRTDHNDLLKYKEGLIICSACLGGEIPQKILKESVEEAEKSALWFKENFGDDYYIELQRHEVIDPQIRANRETYLIQQRVNEELIRIAKKLDIKLVCTNDCHFVDEENGEAHDRLICLSTGRDLDDPARMLYTKQEWFKTQEEMNHIFSDVPEALANTCEICNKVETYSIDNGPIMPNFEIPTEFGTEEQYREKYSHEDLFNEFTRDENGNVVLSQEEANDKINKLGGYDKLYRIKLEADYLSKLAYEGAYKRYGSPLNEETTERINFELHIMKTMGFPGYFLIVQDYIRVAREQLDVSVGPGRGSAAGSAVAYCLGITQVDPIKYDLLFERFLNPDRISLPDIDVDFDDDGRARVLNWVTQKYGAEKVAHIITYGTMATKLALKDVARVQKLPLSTTNRLARLIPDKLQPLPDGKVPKLNLPNVIAQVQELREAEASNDPIMRDTFKYAKMLEGNVRNTGVHACGIIICRDDISDWVPISTADDKKTGEKLRCTQYEGKVIEETGLIKMDFLGLKTLSIIKETLENIKQSIGIKIDIDAIDIDDPATYQLYCDGNTVGTFQFESPGMQKYLRELQPSTFEDLIAMNALYRPGPMQYIPQFIKRKHGEEVIQYDLPCMEKYLKDTYGITVYQEQVMLLSREIADFTRGESDALRKAMGKKLIDKLNQMYPKFLNGGKAKGYDPTVLEKIWEDWRAFASYAFNKSHATCYSWVAYQTAYLKANYPSQYMAGVMSRNVDDKKTITKLMDECKSMSIKTLGPDINESRLKFSINRKGDIRFGLGAIAGVGENAVETIVNERERHGYFTSLYDFVERINLSTCNKKCLENLIMSGAFDSIIDFDRENIYAINDRGETALDSLVKYGVTYQQDKATVSNSLFGGMEDVEISKPPLPKDEVFWGTMQRLNHERDLLGIYISGHPLDEYRVILERICNVKIEELEDLYSIQHTDISFGGIVVDVIERTNKYGVPYGLIKLEDMSGAKDLFIRGEKWANLKGYFIKDSAIFVSARIEPHRFNTEELELNVTKVDFLADILQRVIKKVTISVSLNALQDELASEIIAIIQSVPGDVPLYFNVTDTENRHTVLLHSNSYKVSPHHKLFDFLEERSDIDYIIN